MKVNGSPDNHEKTEDLESGKQGLGHHTGPDISQIKPGQNQDNRDGIDERAGICIKKIKWPDTVHIVTENKSQQCDGTVMTESRAHPNRKDTGLP